LVFSVVFQALQQASCPQLNGGPPPPLLLLPFSRVTPYFFLIFPCLSASPVVFFRPNRVFPFRRCSERLVTLSSNAALTCSDWLSAPGPPRPFRIFHRSLPFLRGSISVFSRRCPLARFFLRPRLIVKKLFFYPPISPLPLRMYFSYFSHEEPQITFRLFFGAPRCATISGSRRLFRRSHPRSSPLAPEETSLLP